MAEYLNHTEEDREYLARRAKRKRMLLEKKKRRRRRLIAKMVLLAGVLIAVIAGVAGSVKKQWAEKERAEQEAKLQEEMLLQEEMEQVVEEEPVEELPVYEFTSNEDTKTIYSENVISSHVILVDESTDTIVASKAAKERINPASMTKVLTVLVAAEHITEEQLDSEGVEPEEAAEAFCGLFQGAERPLLVAYNAQFDLNFLYYLLHPYNRLGVLKQSRFLDALTVYRDRRDYPHKLSDAIQAYCLQDSAVNSHRAVDDVRATVLLLEAMSQEQDDFLEYIDLFGIHPKHGLSGRAISSVTYRKQPYDRMLPLYQRT